MLESLDVNVRCPKLVYTYRTGTRGRAAATCGYPSTCDAITFSVHSDVIAWLLDPKGWHDLGDGFGGRFVAGVLAACGHQSDAPMEIDRVQREFSTGHGPVDILIRGAPAGPRSSLESRTRSTPRQVVLSSRVAPLDSGWWRLSNAVSTVAGHGCDALRCRRRKGFHPCRRKARVGGRVRTVAGRFRDRPRECRCPVRWR